MTGDTLHWIVLILQVLILLAVFVPFWRRP